MPKQLLHRGRPIDGTAPQILFHFGTDANSTRRVRWFSVIENGASLTVADTGDLDTPKGIAAGHRPTTSMKVEQCQAFRMTCVTGWVYNPVSLFLYPSRNHHVCSLASLAFLGPVPGSATLDRGMRVLQLAAPPGLLRGHWMTPCCTTSRRRAWRPCVRSEPAFPRPSSLARDLKRPWAACSTPAACLDCDYCVGSAGYWQNPRTQTGTLPAPSGSP